MTLEVHWHCSKTMRSHPRLCHCAFSSCWLENKQRYLAFVARPGRETLTIGPYGGMLFFQTQRLKTLEDWRTLDGRRNLLTHDLEPTCQGWRATLRTLKSTAQLMPYKQVKHTEAALFVNWLQCRFWNQNHIYCFFPCKVWTLLPVSYQPIFIYINTTESIRIFWNHCVLSSCYAQSNGNFRRCGFVDF